MNYVETYCIGSPIDTMVCDLADRDRVVWAVILRHVHRYGAYRIGL